MVSENPTKETKPILMEIESELWMEAKIQAIRESMMLKEWVALAIKERLERCGAKPN